MISKEALAPSLLKIGAAGGTLLAAAHAPVLAALALGLMSLLVATLALIAALSKGKERRDAAYRVLKLLLDAVRRHNPHQH
jgi:predicted component of type VI protein secretion system